MPFHSRMSANPFHLVKNRTMGDEQTLAFSGISTQPQGWASSPRPLAPHTIDQVAPHRWITFQASWGLPAKARTRVGAGHQPPLLCVGSLPASCFLASSTIAGRVFQWLPCS